MKVVLKAYANAGDLAKERLSLSVLEDVDIGDYVILKSSVRDGGPTSGFKTAFWFPDAIVRAGDTVVLYTKEGSASKKLKIGGGATHFFYWGRKTAYWGGEAPSIAVLLEAPNWKSLPLGETDND